MNIVVVEPTPNTDSDQWKQYRRKYLGMTGIAESRANLQQEFVHVTFDFCIPSVICPNGYCYGHYFPARWLQEI